MKKRTLLIMASLLMFSPLLAQDENEDDFLLDIFSDDDSALFQDPEELSPAPDLALETFEEERPEQTPALIDQLYTNLQGKTTGTATYFFEELNPTEGAGYEPEDDTLVFESRTTVSTFCERGPLRLTAEILSQFGNQEEIYYPALADPLENSISDFLQDKEGGRPNISLIEAYLSLFLENLDLYLGRKIISNTLSSLYSPADVYSFEDLTNPFSGITRGRLLLEADYYLGDWDISAIVFPVYQGNNYYSRYSRWGYYPFTESAVSSPLEVASLSENYPEISPENISCLLKIKTRMKGIDLFASGFYGLNGNIVTKAVRTMDVVTGGTEEVIPVLQTSGGFSAAFEKLELHGEALYNRSIDAKDDNFLRYSLGFRYSFDEFTQPFLPSRMEFTTEYAGEYITKEQDNEDYLFSSESTRGLQNDLLISLENSWEQDLTIRLSGQWEVEYNNFMTLGEITWKGFENIEGSLRWQQFITGEDGNLYAWRDNSSLNAEITVSY